MSARDPRLRAAGASGGGPPPPPSGQMPPLPLALPPPPPPPPEFPLRIPRVSNILLGGQDAMDVDEAVPQAARPTHSHSGYNPLQQQQMNPQNELSPEDVESLHQEGATDLISIIVTPSPYPQHISGPTSARFRNALGRITSNPASDVEAWQALLTEVNACYQNLKMSGTIHPAPSSSPAETHRKLDWIESCYGMLLKYFPYSSTHVALVLELLLAQSARVGEQDGPFLPTNSVDIRAQIAELKIDRLFERVLGIHMDGTAVSIDDNHSPSKSAAVIGGMCTSSVDLWLLYIRKRSRDAARLALTLPQIEAVPLVRKWTTDAYEVAISHASFVADNHVLWKQYLQFVKDWDKTDSSDQIDHLLAQQKMLQLRSVYQRLVTHPMTGLDQLWQEYEAFERSQSEALAAALLAEFLPKYQHARTVYLERNRIYSPPDLQLTTKFATPPVDRKDDGVGAGASAGAGGERSGKSKSGSGADVDGEEDMGALIDSLNDEYNFLTLWKKRIAYERTNPERLSATELSQRVRQAYKEMGCVLTRYPEVWCMWSSWEINLSVGDAIVRPSNDKNKSTQPLESDKLGRAVAVLKLGQEHILDCTLLAYEHARVLEHHTASPSSAIDIMKLFVDRSPNTLGFILLQQLVRRYKGIAPARAVFSKARRTLEMPESVENSNDAVTDDDGGGSSEALDDKNRQKRVITNRLDANIGTDAGKDTSQNGSKNEVHQSLLQAGNNGINSNNMKPGPVTWHLYAAHATIEHRLNRAPDTAARVYELGLRKHAWFLTKPAYVMQYARLLLELQDHINLRALLTRALAACEDSNSKEGSSANSAVAALWDMTLHFESLISGSDPTTMSAIEAIEQRRRAALMGPNVEDVATGGFVGIGDSTITIGTHKSSIAEQLVRSDGYDVNSRIVCGINRTVDVLSTTGLWGSGSDSVASASGRLKFQELSSRKELTARYEDVPGGKSDSSYQRRLNFQSLVGAGISADIVANDSGAIGVGGSRLVSARERLQGAAAVSSMTNTPIMMVIQQNPEWLRPLLLLLPASKLRTPIISQPPPHLTEIALSSLRQSALPSERPSDSLGSKRRIDGHDGGDSSDEENEGSGGGYGIQFRKRQRERQIQAAGGSTIADVS